MTPAFLAELADLFTAEAMEAERQCDPFESERLWDIAIELQESCARVELEQARKLARTA